MNELTHEISPMTEFDLDQVLAIERSSFHRPWTLEGFRTELNRIPPAVNLVLRNGSMVCGFLVYWLIPPEIHILNIAVRPDLRGRGLGRRLVDHMIRHGREKDVEEMFLEVRPSNKDARRLYERSGFVQSGLRKNYYAEDNEDAIIMTLRLDENRSRAV